LQRVLSSRRQRRPAGEAAVLAAFRGGVILREKAVSAALLSRRNRRRSSPIDPVVELYKQACTARRLRKLRLAKYQKAEADYWSKNPRPTTFYGGCQRSLAQMERAFKDQETAFFIQNGPAFIEAARQHYEALAAELRERDDVWLKELRAARRRFNGTLSSIPHRRADRLMRKTPATSAAGIAAKLRWAVKMQVDSMPERRRSSSLPRWPAPSGSPPPSAARPPVNGS
jgi:hypothetical protein